MRRHALWVLFGGIAAVSAGACGEDSPATSAPASSGAGAGAGAGGEPTVQAGEGGAAGGEVTPAIGGAAGAPAITPEGGDASSGAGGAPVVVSRAVRGRVRAGWAGFPGVVVLVDGQEVTSGADGSFSVEEAPDEYELMVYVPEFRLVRVYDGVRTREPIVNLGVTELSGDLQRATVQGKVQGGAEPPQPTDFATEVLYLSSTRGLLHRSSIQPPEPFDMSLRWQDAGTVDDGEILVVQTALEHGKAVSQYLGYGKRAVKVRAGALLGSLSGSPLTDVALVDPEEYVVAGTLEVPSDLSLSTHVLRVGGWQSPLFFAPGSYSLSLPAVPEPKALHLELFGDHGMVRGSWPLPDTATSDLALTMPPIPTLVSPEPDATMTPVSELSWEPLPESSVALVWMKINDFTLERVTTASHASLVDLSKLGAALAPGPGSWSVQAIGPASSVDDVLRVQQDAATEATTSWFFAETMSQGFDLGRAP